MNMATLLLSVQVAKSLKLIKVMNCATNKLNRKAQEKRLTRKTMPALQKAYCLHPYDVYLG